MSAPLYRQKLLQNVREHDAFLSILRAEGVRSYLEIGSMYGGSLYRVATVMPRESRIVSIDYACDTPEALPHLEHCILDLARRGYDTHLIVGDSASPSVVDRAKSLAPFDCVFIDGAHTAEAVRNDWQNYGSLGRLVAFHDIAWNNTWKSAVPGREPKAMGVPDLWNELKTAYRHRELRYQRPSNYYGIGVLWRHG